MSKYQFMIWLIIIGLLIFAVYHGDISWSYLKTTFTTLVNKL